MSHTPKRQPENEFMSTFSLRCIKSRPREAVTISGQSNPDFRNSILSYVRETFLFFINTNKQIKQPFCLKLLLKLRWSSTKHSNPSACWVITVYYCVGRGQWVRKSSSPLLLLLIEATVKTGGRFRAQQQYPTDLCRIANKGGRILRRPLKIQGLPAPIVKEHSLPSSHIKSWEGSKYESAVFSVVLTLLPLGAN